MSKEKLKQEERKVKFSVTINPALYKKIDELNNNKSKYIESLIYMDLIKNKHISKNIVL